MDSLKEVANALIEYLNYLMQDKDISFLEILSENMGVILSSLVAIITVIVSIASSKTDHKRKIKEKEYDKYKKELEEFYYPLLYLLGLNTSLYSCFALKEKKENPNFRTLIALIEKRSFSDTDTRILHEIIANNKKINQLILEKGLYVEKDEIRQMLIKLSTHYTIINLAYDKKINEQCAEYEEMVFPRDIHKHINAEITRIEEKLGRK